MFPLIMTAGATLFLAPHWPRRFGVGGAAAIRPARPMLGPRMRFALVTAHLVAQIILPLRRYALAGPSAWTGAGFNFAWNVMVAEKSGAVTFSAVDARSGRVTTVRPSQYLTPQQEAAMAQDPDLIAALARHIATDLKARAGVDVGVFADARAALNGRPAQPLLDPSSDLAAAPPRVLPLR
jgi:vitamin K-dependent gamma-carboxylase